MNKFEGKIIVVTGGAEGIGYNISDKFLQNGAKIVIILDINETKGVEAVNTLNCKHGDRAAFIKCDVTKDLEAVYDQIITTYKKVDVLVNNAGVSDEKSVSRTISINLTAVMEWTMKFWEHMRTDKGGNGGTILNISSMAGFLLDPFMIYYKTSKFAVLAFTKSLGHEYNFKKTGVRIIALCPGLTATSLIKEQLCWDEHEEDFKKFSKTFPCQKADAVGNAALEAMEKAPSGTAWVVSGGQPLVEAPEYVKLTMDHIEHPEKIPL